MRVWQNPAASSHHFTSVFPVDPIEWCHSTTWLAENDPKSRLMRNPDKFGAGLSWAGA
jgi:hypothetical protein